MNRPERTRPFFFGPDERLFGVLDLPAAGAMERGPVLVVPPVGHEAIWSHRGLRRLASELASRGFAVLRYDHEGCGDSAGEPHEVAFERWVGGVDVARAWLADRFGAPDVVGLRLGGTLALLADAARTGALVLWEPVLDGAAYLREQRALHVALLRELGLATEPDGDEVLGFRRSESATRALAHLDLSAVDPRRPVLVLANRSGSIPGALATRAEVVEEEATWATEPFRMHVPVRSHARVVAFLEDPS